MSTDDRDDQPMISAEEYARGWDSERRVHELDPLLFNLRGTGMYVPARTKADMDEVMGGPALRVKTRTFAKEYRVWISPCLPTDPDARNLRPTTDTQGTAEFGFGIPLRKMEIKVPPTRQYSLKAKRLPVANGGVVYEISFADFANTPRKTGASGGDAEQGDQ